MLVVPLLGLAPLVPPSNDAKVPTGNEVSWTTRTWSSLMAQRMSVALHMAAAWEIARELSLAGAEDEAALFGGGVADSVA